MDPVAGGGYFLGPGVELHPGPRDELGSAVLVQPDPLRAIRVNPSAAALLEQCRSGLPAARLDATPAVRKFIDALLGARLLEWRPGPLSPDAPSVSIIVPVYNRAGEIGDCLAALFDLDYPESRREIIVVDDASTDNSAQVVRTYPVRLLTGAENEGQSAARNRGVEAARGEIVAFIDSDCIADPDWLSALVPPFADPRVALVGGYVGAWSHQTRLDRFEAVGSPLNMGDRPLIGEGDRSVLYVPTCNMLVRRSAYLATPWGGLDPARRVGEDVDLCWRLMDAGHRILYLPRGRVRHRHRNRFWPGFVRRFEYGTSEPALYATHRRAAKRFPWQTGGALCLGLTSLGAVVAPAILLPAAGAVLLAEAVLRKRAMDRMTAASLPFWSILRATARSHLLLGYYLSHHVIRYHLPLLAALTAFFPSLLPLTLGLLALPITVTYVRHRPELDPITYGACFLAEQVFYGAGVLRGSIQHRHLKCYRISFARAGFLKRSPSRAADRFKARLRAWMERPGWMPFR